MKPSMLIAAVFLAALTACNRTEATVAGGDPANGNLAPVADAAPPAQPADAAPQPAAQPANVAPTSPVDYSAPPIDDGSSDFDQQAVEATEPPPPLPQYDQPPCPGDNYLWTPGYWDYANTGYYWVPGAWVMAPYVGALWTPPWWGYNNNAYVWHAGYWGPHIGFYGGIDYGFGYTGRGYYGAYWNSGRVVYNRSVTNVNVSVVHNNVYNYSVPSARGERVSYNGGRGGINVRPTAQESAAVRDRRTPPVQAQVQHAREAAGNREQFSSGRARPTTLAAPRPLATEYRAPAEHAPERNAAPPRVAQPAQPFDSRQPGRPQPSAPSAERIHQEPAPHGAAPVAPHPAAPEVRPAMPQNHADRMVRPEGRPPQQPVQQHAVEPQHQVQQPHPVEQRHVEQSRAQQPRVRPCSSHRRRPATSASRAAAAPDGAAAACPAPLPRSSTRRPSRIPNPIRRRHPSPRRKGKVLSHSGRCCQSMRWMCLCGWCPWQ